MKLFDLHCDTPLELYKGSYSLKNAPLHISLEKAGVFDKYVQVGAIWSDKALCDGDCFKRWTEASCYFQKEAGSMLVSSREELENSSRFSFISAVEDIRLASHSLDTLLLLHKKGVRVATLLWGGISAIGGAWDTNEGLSPLGKEALEILFSLGIIPDISHASQKSSDYIISRAKNLKKAAIATHSNSFAVYPHKRNLTDETAKELSSLGSIIGVSLCPAHLCNGMANIEHVTDHIIHYANICGTDSVSLGCDFDGIGATPEGLSHIGMLPRLHESLVKRAGNAFADKVFYNNAYNFFINNL